MSLHRDILEQMASGQISFPPMKEIVDAPVLLWTHWLTTVCNFTLLDYNILVSYLILQESFLETAKTSHSKIWVPQFARLTTSHPLSAFSSPTLPPTTWIRVMEKIPLTWLTWIFIIKESNTMHRWHVSSIRTRTQMCLIIMLHTFSIFLHLPGKDFALEPNQGAPHVPFVDELLASATGKDKEGNPILTLKDLAAYSSKRRVDARVSNPEYYKLDFPHKLFGSSKWGPIPIKNYLTRIILIIFFTNQLALQLCSRYSEVALVIWDPFWLMKGYRRGGSRVLGIGSDWRSPSSILLWSLWSLASARGNTVPNRRCNKRKHLRRPWTHLNLSIFFLYSPLRHFQVGHLDAALERIEFLYQCWISCFGIYFIYFYNNYMMNPEFKSTVSAQKHELRALGL